MNRHFDPCLLCSRRIAGTSTCEVLGLVDATALDTCQVAGYRLHNYSCRLVVLRFNNRRGQEGYTRTRRDDEE
jgi:hypothetical protein